MKQKTNQAPGGRTRIRKGDEVIVISGSKANRETPRRVLAVYPQTNRILVEGVGVAKRSYKKGSNPDLPQGGIHDKGMPIHISNVMLVDPKNGGPTRIGMKVETKDGKTIRTRFAKASGTDIKD
jgi:large subunit ribosomal protein L24